MKLDITAATLKPAAEKLVARLNQMGVVSKTGQPLVVDHGFEVVAALLGRRNQHALRAALTDEAKCSCCSPAPAVLDDAKIAILKTLGYSVALSDFKRPYWQHGDDASEDFNTEAEAWLAAMADARARRRFADGNTVIDPLAEMVQAIEDLKSRWGEQHGWYTQADWHHDAAAGDTKLGYWDWVMHNIESHGGEEEHCSECGKVLDGEGWDGKCGECADHACTVDNHCTECGEYERECTCEKESAAPAPAPTDLAQDAYEQFDFQAALGDHYTVEDRNGFEYCTGTPEVACTVFLQDSRTPDEPTRRVRFIVDVVDGVARNPRVTD
jgi:hypothetical protein